MILDPHGNDKIYLIVLFNIFLPIIIIHPHYHMKLQINYYYKKVWTLKIKQKNLDVWISIILSAF